MNPKYVVMSGTDRNVVIGTADTLETALFLRGADRSKYFNHQIYELIDVSVSKKPATDLSSEHNASQQASSKEEPKQ